MGAAKSPKRVLCYEERFKARAVQLSKAPGVRVKDVAESRDIHPLFYNDRRAHSVLGYRTPAAFERECVRQPGVN